MEPRIQYAKTSDGVSIAYYSVGDGPPLVFMPAMPFSHIEMQLRNSLLRGWIEHAAKGLTLIRYDNRGAGLSDRDVSDLSLDAMVHDLEAVVGQVGCTKFSLYAWGQAGPTAITFAARYPERIPRLVLWETAANKDAFREIQGFRSIESLVEADWVTYTETLAHTVLGWSEGKAAHAYAGLFREAISRETYQQFVAEPHDASAVLHDVRSPTLVGHERGAHHHVIEFAKILASGIPNARLMVADVGPHGMPTEEVASAINEFVSAGDETRPQLPHGTAVILFADIVDSTALTEEIGDSAFRDKARNLDTSLRDIITKAEGTPVEGKLLGDGVLAVFTSAKNAIDAALRFGKAAEAVGLGLHIGIHAGDVIEEDGNVFGGAVNIAARVAAESAPGEVLVSQTVRDLARTSAGVEFEDAGERTLKGVGEPVRVWRVHQA